MSDIEKEQDRIYAINVDAANGKLRKCAAFVQVI